MLFDTFVADRRPALLRFAAVLTGQPWLADDIVSDVLGRAYERWDHISRLDEPYAYVRRMVVNDHLSWRRRLARTAPHDDLEVLSESIDDASKDIAERDAMLQRLAQLPRKQCAAVVLRYYSGLSDDAIAEHLGCRPSTVRSQISRALAALRIELSATLVPSLITE